MRSSGLLALALALIACTRAGVSATPAPVPPTAQLTADDRTLIAAAVDTILSGKDRPGTVCVAIVGGTAGAEEPDSTVLQAFRSKARFVTQSQCPPTYASPFPRIDTAGRVVDAAPPGHVDPIQLFVGRPQFESSGYARLQVRQAQGTGGREYRCTVEHHPPAPTRASCRLQSVWLS